MEKAIMLMGKVGRQESYQLLINQDYISNEFDNSSDRDRFYDELSEFFVEEIMRKSQKTPMLELGVLNGLRINPETGRNEKIAPLETNLVEQFSGIVCEKLKRAPIQTMPSFMRN